MSKAIKINFRKATEEDTFDTSRFFGAPAIPEAWEDRFAEDIIFFAQIKLEEIAKFDPENRLPHTGWLYFFLDTAAYPYDVWVEHYDGEPEVVVDDFNEIDPEFSNLAQGYIATFEECGEFDSCTRLFGGPTLECDEQSEPLLLQFDPYDGLGFLEYVDGYAYVFCNAKEKGTNTATCLVVERT